MPPTVALILWFILLVALWRMDPAKEPGTSQALWVPLIWFFFVATRLPSQWLGRAPADAAQALEEGSAVDRGIFSLLILLAIAILVSRSFAWDDFLLRNFALMALLTFAVFSVLWSDYHLVALKRWVRDVGSYLMILVVLSDVRPFEAVRTLLRRLFYLVIPLSILLCKYYPTLSRAFNQWTGEGTFTGAATSKNVLGAMCLVAGIFFFWDMVVRWGDRKDQRTKRILLVDGAFTLYTFYLLRLAHSATSSVCLALGCLVIALCHSRVGKRHPTLVKMMPLAMFCLYLTIAAIGLNGRLAEMVGRNENLTDRTRIWGILLSMHTNPLIGTGYESFWLGSRIEQIWSQFSVHVTEAHNGYLEVYLNLGILGLVIMTALFIASYRTICKRLNTFPVFGSFALAVWAVFLFHNVTEADVKTSNLLWLTFLLGGIAVVGRDEERVPAAAAPEDAHATENLAVYCSPEMRAQWR